MKKLKEAVAAHGAERYVVFVPYKKRLLFAKAVTDTDLARIDQLLRSTVRSERECR